jgi:transcriptional regulator with PAS, ATPase and Fis domain
MAISRRQRLDLDDPKTAEQLRFRLESSIEATGGRLKLVAKSLGVSRTTVWRWVHRLGLAETLDEVRARNLHPRREKSFRWYLTNQPERAREILRDILWRNDGILDAVAVEMRCSQRTVYYRVEKLGLWAYARASRSAAEKKRLLGKPEPDREPSPRAPYIYPEPP